MTSRLLVVVEGEPVAKGRPRLSTRGGFSRMHPTKESAAYEKRVKAACAIEATRAGWPHAAPEAVKRVRFRVVVRVYRSKAGVGGDLDNYVKSALDGCNGVAFADDRYVVELAAMLRQDRARPRVQIEITALEAS